MILLRAHIAHPVRPKLKIETCGNKRLLHKQGRKKMQLVPYHNHATSLMVSNYFCELVFCMDFDGTIARAFVHTGQTALAPATNLFIFPTSKFIYFTNVFFYYFMHFFLFLSRSLSCFVVQFSAAVDSSVTEQSVCGIVLFVIRLFFCFCFSLSPCLFHSLGILLYFSCTFYLFCTFVLFIVAISYVRK